QYVQCAHTNRPPRRLGPGRDRGRAAGPRREKGRRVSGDALLLLYAAVDVVALILLIARWKVHPFIALVGVSLALGLAAGMKPLDVADAFQTGVGNVLGFIAGVVALGTMLGKIMAESGAATRIATTMVDRFGESRVHWAIMLVAVIIGIP